MKKVIQIENLSKQYKKGQLKYLELSPCNFSLTIASVRIEVRNMKLKKSIVLAKTTWLAIAIFMAASAPATVLAATPETTVNYYPPEADMKLTLFSEFPLYDSYGKPGALAAALSPVQTVKLKAHWMVPDPEDSYPQPNIYNDWFLVETIWIGDKWIHMTDGISKFGDLEEKLETVTLVEDTVIYDAPSPSHKTELVISAQPIKATASITACDPYSRNFTCDKYFRVNTWVGEKWIAPASYMEKIKEEPLNTTITLTNEADVYELPFFNKKTDKKLQPQTLDVLSKYWVLLGRAGPTIWYKVETPDGLRWIAPYDAYLGMEKTSEKIKIPVSFHFYFRPNEYAQEDKVQQPAELQASGKLGDWYYVVLSPTEYRWVNPTRALAENPQGVKTVHESIRINELSYIAEIPYAETGTPSRLTFADQSVTATRKWVSPNGETWYLISTWNGDKWARP